MDNDPVNRELDNPQEELTRRELLLRGMLGAASVVAARSLPGTPAAATAKPAKAKSVIQIWMWGGPCHLDTFDPKPAAGYDYCGPLNKPIATNVSGIRICELLPQLAKQADKYSILRSMTHRVNAHETASYRVQTGRDPAERIVYPSVGAVVSLFRGRDYRGLVPPYVVLTEPQGRFSEAGFLGSKYKPFATGGDPNQARFAVEGIVTEGVTEQRKRTRRDLLRSLDTLGQAMASSPQFLAFDRCGANAEQIAAESQKVFDLSGEKPELRDRYGRNTFGQSCLVARRLVENGVPHITINYKGWDTHKQHFETMRRKLPEMDQGMATLLQDLSDRGLLDSTIVWWTGEFGRTPRVAWEAPWNGGRGHFGNCFCALLAGGGFKGGQVVGASDARGEEVAERPVRPEDLIGSIYESLGINPDAPMPNPKGLSVQVMPAEHRGPGTGRLREIMG